MKNKLVIALLAAALVTTALTGCGKKETAEQTVTESTEAVAVETEAPVMETETEETTESAELVYNTESEEPAETTAKGEKTAKTDDSKNADTKTADSKDSKKDTGKTDTAKNDTAKNDTAKNDAGTNTGAATDTPAQTPAETPAETPAPEEPAQNLCPYGPLWTWMDFGDGWWGFYDANHYADAATMEADHQRVNTEMETNFYEKGLIDDNWSKEFLGRYDDAGDVYLNKYHFIVNPNAVNAE